MKKLLFFSACFIFANQCFAQKTADVNFSGIYPALASFNGEGECGTGAVVNWAGKLWMISYGPHLPFGSTDKLYEVSPQLKQTIRPESIGGTPANRMIHKESKQLFIGHYVIDSEGKVRVIPISIMPGRLTGIARSTTNPENKVVFATMEEGFYEVDVHSLEVKTLYKDGNQQRKEGARSYESDLMLGVHGKGFYSSQGVYVYSNNGEQGEEARVNPRIQAGSLYEYDGTQWKLIRRNQFTEVTGPGGIEGNKKTTDPIWATGWDYKSVLLALRDNGQWSFYRLPKASNSYDGAHGWNTEWPRIRNVGNTEQPNYLMTMHGMFWHFPENFSSEHTAGLRPRSSYLKVIGDFTRWNDQLVFGCDDAAKSEFLNKRKAKGGIGGPGQSQSNLWFTSLQMPDQLGSTNSDGAVWLKEQVKAAEVSEPYLFAGWNNKTVWIKNLGEQATRLEFEVDARGNNHWSPLQSVQIASQESMLLYLSSSRGEWVRVRNSKASALSVSFVYHNPEKRTTVFSPMFKGLAAATAKESIGGLLYSLGNDQKKLGIIASINRADGTVEKGYYEMDEKMKPVPVSNDSISTYMREKMAIPTQVVLQTEGAYKVIDETGKAWCLPLGLTVYKDLMKANQVRICREVVTERDLFNCGGTFYELPAENAGGYAKIKPISSHQFSINDYTSYRGMLVMTGIDLKAATQNRQIVVSDDQQCAVWAGVVDDLWKLGKPTGHGGPWVKAAVVANQVSDAYLFTGYDKRELVITQHSDQAVRVTMEIDPLGENDWVKYKTFTLQPLQTINYTIPSSVQGRWVRFVSDKNSTLTTWLNYH